MTRARSAGAGRAAGARAYWPGLFASLAPERKFVIFTTGRTGSKLLVGLLSSHSRVVCDSEILAPPRRRWPMRFVEAQAVRARFAGASAYGFKLLTAQISEAQGLSDPPAFLRRLSERGYLIVLLTRRNLLRQTASWAAAQQRGRFHVPTASGESRFEAVRIEPEEVVAMMFINEKIAARLESEASDVPHISLVYEDDLADPARHQATVDRIMGALGLPSEPVEAPFARTSPDRLADMFENYDDVAALLEQTRFAHFIDDEPLP